MYTYTFDYNLLGHVQTVEAVRHWMTEELPVEIKNIVLAVASNDINELVVSIFITTYIQLLWIIYICTYY